MENKRFSLQYKGIDQNTLCKKIQSDIETIRTFALNQDVKVIELGEQVGFVFELEIPLPTRGTYENVDIREVEPIIIKASKNLLGAPRVYSDRTDFPMNKLPHLNPVEKGSPACFCLHRGDINEWYAEHDITDFIIRIREWLRDAAANRLMKLNSGDEFEASRLSSLIGTIIYDPKYLYSISYKENLYDFVWCEIIVDGCLDENILHYSIKLRGVIPTTGYDEAKNLFNEINELKNKENSLIKLNKSTFGIFIKNYSNICNMYFGEFPTKYNELLVWATDLGIDLESALIEYKNKGFDILMGIPIIIAIKRPKKIIGSGIDIEFLNFLIVVGDNGIQDDSNVYMLANRKPLTLDFARELSKNNKYIAEKTIFLGCGAVGSKMALHLAKSGVNDLVFVDNDDISPHNLIRHGLLSSSLGKGKSKALEEEIKNIFYADSQLKSSSFEKNGEVFLSEYNSSSSISLIIDTTASNAFNNYLADIPNLKKCCIIRCELANNGDLGILKVEGGKRNPRIDDLRIFLFDRAIDDQYLSKWLKSWQENKDFEFEDINIGVGCSSDTMKLSDDIISLHSSIFSASIKNLTPENLGFIQLSKYNKSSDELVTVKKLYLSEIIEKNFDNDQGWKLRISKDNIDLMKCKLKENGSNETGGLLIGRVDRKREIIYVTRIIDAPDDSVKKPYLFKRGVQDVSEKVREIRELTGGLIDYVGEWHTHINKIGKLSETDRNAIGEIRRSLDKIPYPTFILIVTEIAIHPYIFGPPKLIHANRGL